MGLEFDEELEAAYRRHRCMRQCRMDRVRVALRLLFGIVLVSRPGAHLCAVPAVIQFVSIVVDAVATLSLRPASEGAYAVRPIIMSIFKLVEATPAYWLSTCRHTDLTSLGAVMRHCVFGMNLGSAFGWSMFDQAILFRTAIVVQMLVTLQTLALYIPQTCGTVMDSLDAAPHLRLPARIAAGVQRALRAGLAQGDRSAGAELAAPLAYTECVAALRFWHVVLAFLLPLAVIWAFNANARLGFLRDHLAWQAQAAEEEGGQAAGDQVLSNTGDGGDGGSAWVTASQGPAVCTGSYAAVAAATARAQGQSDREAAPGLMLACMADASAWVWQATRLWLVCAVCVLLVQALCT